MRRKDAGSGGVPQGGARFRWFVHPPGRMPGLNLTTEICPYGNDCPAGGGIASNGHAPNGHAPNGHGANGASFLASASSGLPEFRALTAARRWRQARPYFRGRPPMVFGCPRAQVPDWGCPLATRVREEARTVVTEPEDSAARVVSAPGAAILVPVAAPTSPARRTIPSSSPGSRRAG